MSVQGDQEYIHRHIVSQARYMAWDDARCHFETKKIWSEEMIESASLDYSKADTWHHPFVIPDKAQRELFCVEYATCYRQEIARRRRKAKGNILRVKDMLAQLVFCGGLIWTRKELYDQMIKDGTRAEDADFFAFRLKEYEGDW